MRFQVLGTVGTTGDGAVALGTAAKPRLMLAILLAHADRPVSTDRLIEGIWGEHPPASARRNVQLYAHRLRGVLGANVLVSAANGYEVRTRGHLDAVEFEAAVSRSEELLAAGDLAAAKLALQHGLDLWAGDAFAEFRDNHLIVPAAQRLEQLRIRACLRWAESAIRVNAGEAVLAQLAELVRHHPYHEELRALLMRALAQCGRPAEALQSFHELRRLLADELGVVPTAAIQRVFGEILRGEPSRPVRPAQLPADLPCFAGRENELSALGKMSNESTVVISGPPGVGKTTLAVHWAHRVVDHFPDGQLYVNLRGFDPSGRPMDPGDALTELLEALDDRGRPPASLAAAAARFRSLVAARRILLVVDNARNAEQVRPLLPGSGTSLAIVTSRDGLDGLLASEGAHYIALPVLTTGEATALLAGRLGTERVSAEPEAVADLARLCDHLPLALAVVAARIARQPGHTLGWLARELHEAGNILDALATGDETTDLRAVLAYSYQVLSRPAARLFALVGRLPVPTMSVTAAASLAGGEPAAARILLAELSRANLVAPAAPDRYVMHDVLRAYAAERQQENEPEAERMASADRLLDHYLHTACRATQLLYPHRLAIAVGDPVEGVAVAPMSDHDSARQWFLDEQDAVLALVDRAHRAGRHGHAWRLAWSIAVHLDRRGQWEPLLAALHIGLKAAAAGDDPIGMAHCHHQLAIARTWLGQFEAAQSDYQQAIAYFRQLADRVAEAHSHLNRALLCEQQGDIGRAEVYAGRALRLFDEEGHTSGRAKALNALGWYEAALGQLDRARAHCQLALELMHDLGDTYGKALTWDSLGYIHGRCGAHAEAIRCYERSLDLCRTLQDGLILFGVLHRLGDAHLAADHPDAARRAWAEASAITAATHEDRAVVAEKLVQLRDRSAPA